MNTGDEREGLRGAENAPEAPSVLTCTGVGAVWCPIHGDCSCPHNEHGEPVLKFEAGPVAIAPGLIGWSETAKVHQLIDPACPLHSAESSHAVQGAW